ncbi:MAG: hypothetical protein ACE10K_05385 [Rhodothermales bacterium]
MPVSYIALVTPAEVKTAMMGSMETSMALQVDALLGVLYDGVIDLVEDATGVIERFLDRELIIRSQTLLFHSGRGGHHHHHHGHHGHGVFADFIQREGYENANQALLFVAWARQWPGIQLISVDKDATKAPDMQLVSAGGSADVERLAYDPDSTLITERPFEVAMFAGYRRADEGVGTPGSGDSWTLDLLLETGAPNRGSQFDLSGLTVATEDIPLLPRDIRRAALRITIFDIRQQMLGLLGLESSVKQVDRMTVDLQKTREEFIDDELAQIFNHRYIPTGMTP